MITFSITGSAKLSDAIEGYCPDLRDILISHGAQEVNANDADCVIFINHNKEWVRTLKNLNHKHMILIRLEPKAVFPAQYTDKIEKLYDLIITPGFADQSNDFIGWPYKHHANPAKPANSEIAIDSVINKLQNSEIFKIDSWSKRETKIVMIAANKISPVAETGYKIRRKLAKANLNNVLDVYGSYWRYNYGKRIKQFISMAKFNLKNGTFVNFREAIGGLTVNIRSAKGEIENKHFLLSNYKFSLVIENSVDYVSEKIFDSMLSGTIPIYIGPDLQNFGISEECYVELDSASGDLEQLISNLTNKQAERMLLNIKRFILSDQFLENWSSKNVYEKIALRIENYWEARV
jgi:hypothetical protein